MDYEVASLLYSAYAVNDSQYGEFVNGLSNYKVPLYDMFMFVKDEMRKGNVTFSGDTQEKLDDLFDQLDAPVRRVAALNSSVPFCAELEDEIYPNPERIAAAAAALVRE